MTTTVVSGNAGAADRDGAARVNCHSQREQRNVRAATGVNAAALNQQRGHVRDATSAGWVTPAYGMRYPALLRPGTGRRQVRRVHRDGFPQLVGHLLRTRRGRAPLRGRGRRRGPRCWRTLPGRGGARPNRAGGRRGGTAGRTGRGAAAAAGPHGCRPAGDLPQHVDLPSVAGAVPVELAGLLLGEVHRLTGHHQVRVPVLVTPRGTAGRRARVASTATGAFPRPADQPFLRGQRPRCSARPAPGAR